MKKSVFGLLLLGLPMVALAAKLPVVASFSIVGDMTREIGGDRVEVVSLVGPDQDAHVFQPSPADVKRLSASRLFVTNGLGLEGWMGRLTKASGYKGLMVEAGNGIKTRMAPAEEGEEKGREVTDPHAWHDPQRVQVYIRNITAGLIKADPQGKADYTRRAAEFSAKVKQQDEWAAQQFAAIPAAKRKMLTSHDAFGYFGERYGIKLLAIQGVSTEAEASAKGVAQLVKQVRQEKVNAIFMENMTDKRLLEQLTREAKVKIGGELYADALSKPNGPASSYLKLFHHNVETILQSIR
ncbi:MAG: metal ABC transporter substrate-binding protein [Aquitalea sp.]|nr:metal ABC transporter substrate-binding protein [Aquitalea sp.]